VSDNTVLPPAAPAEDAPPAAVEFPFGTSPTPSVTGSRSLELERRSRKRVRSTGVLDWVAFVLAFIAPPLGVLVAIASLIVSYRIKGWTAGIAKAALAIGVVFTVVLAGGLFLLNNVNQRQGAHDAIVASSRQYCSELRSVPGRLQSPTYGWPAVQDTVQDSLTAMQKYEDTWKALVAVAPDGIRTGTQQVDTAAQSIIANVTSSRVLDDPGNVAQMQQAVSTSGIANWVAGYCN
jgi:hypothetical protein